MWIAILQVMQNQRESDGWWLTCLCVEGKEDRQPGRQSILNFHTHFEAAKQREL